MATAQLSRLPMDLNIRNEKLTDEELADEELPRLSNPRGGKWEVVDGKW